MLDVFFITHGEENADENWHNLSKICPRARRLDNIGDLYQTHGACARQSSTENFFVVDADAWVYETFDFGFDVGDAENKVFIWSSINPVNDLVYGYGGVKLFPKKPFLENHVWNTDLSTTIGSSVVIMEGVSCETRFNSTPKSAWIGAFRECAKLSSLRSLTLRLKKNLSQLQEDLDKEVEYLQSQDWSKEQKENYLKTQKIYINEKYKSLEIYHHWKELQDSNDRVTAWTRFGWTRKNGNHTVLGARAGMAYGLSNAHDDHAMNKINDWVWLESRFQEYKLANPDD